MNRKLVVTALAALLLAAVAALAAPWVIRALVESRVDATLENIRVRSTSMVNRGEVTVELANRIVVIHGLTIVPPGAGSKVRIGSLRLVEPWPSEGRLTARRIVLENIAVTSAADRTTIPRIELRGYSGPEEGLVTTPGTGYRARSQADVIAQVSVDAINIPSIETVAERTGIRRSFRNISVTRLMNGVIDIASIEGVSIRAPKSGRSETSAFELTASAASLDGLDLPTLWRFYAGDGVGDRQPLVSEFSASRLALRAGGVGSGEITAKADAASVTGVELRPLTFTLSEIDDIVAKLKDDEALTPADVRRKLLMMVEAVRAVSFEAIHLSGLGVEVGAAKDRRLTTTMRAVAIGPYADARLEQASVDGLAYSEPGGRSLQIAQTRMRGLDASRLTAYAERIGRDEILLAMQPTAEDVVRTAPRIGGLELHEARFSGAIGDVAVANAQLDVNAPLDAVPQHVGLALDGVDIAPREGSSLAATLRTVALERARGSARLAVTLDPATRELSLNSLEAKIEDLGSIRASGGLAKVDPRLAISTGSEFIDKLSEIVLEPFRIAASNDGLFETALRRAAQAADEPHDAFRDALATRAGDEIATLFGPPARQSAEAVSAFIRQPRSIEITINPKTPDTRLIDFLQSLPLGPAGIAQTIDVTILNRR
ncbi:hypothetical protein [Hansschlegelia sp.]|uniref:hypothetical protein n=1 Tax=Hansschlegelia sp. TaxID=2041892 RepID=UPI002B7C3DD5|nr:hypothetical protein [Hansschlegelia sp.]HVI29125.1 hypothetical protein [Hansschlegelia sp.]